MLGVLIPEVEGTVTAGGAEGAVDGVEGDGVDGVDVVDIALRSLTVALETEVVGGVLVLDILDRTAALDTADGEASGSREAADYSRLPLEGRLHGLVEFGGVFEVDDVDVAVCGADHEKFVLDIHGVNTLLALHRGNGV